MAAAGFESPDSVLVTRQGFVCVVGSHVEAPYYPERDWRAREGVLLQCLITRSLRRGFTVGWMPCDSGELGS